MARKSIIVLSAISILLLIIFTVSMVLQINASRPKINSQVQNFWNGEATSTQTPKTPNAEAQNDDGNPRPEKEKEEVDEGYIGPQEPVPTSIMPQLPKPAATGNLPIVAMVYSGAGGPKKCRGSLLTALNLPRPAAQHKQGACYDLPGSARCGVFVSNKGDHCEAQLYNTHACLNNSRSYVNTVVFMPEMRPIGAYWKSMFVRCAVEAPEAVVLDPKILGDLKVSGS